MARCILPEQRPDISLHGDGFTCSIYELGTHRVVHIEGPHYGTCGVISKTVLRTRSSLQWLQRLFAAKGAWTANEILRAEGPLATKTFDYCEQRYGVDFQRARVLDLGCGFGASAIQILERGASFVLALDVEEQSVKMASQRIRDFGFHNRALVARIGEDGRLPASDLAFDVVAALEVFEHVLPSLRAPLLRTLYGKVAPGGVLLISAPNRIVPKDLHTSGLWFVNYMPRFLATKCARLLSPRCRGKDDASLIAAGLLSFSWWEAARSLRGTNALDLSLESPPQPDLVPSSSRAGAVWNRLTFLAWRLGRGLCPNCPFDAFTGHLFLAFQRPTDARNG